MGRDRAARPEAEALRLFVAVDVSPEAAEAVERAAAAWQERLGAGRWVPRGNWHVTLKFLGRTWPRLLTWVEESCRAAAAEVGPFDVSLGGMGVFPGASRARVLWVGLDDRGGELVALARGLDERLASEFPPEKRDLTPHLTVARFNPPVPFREHAEAVAAVRLEAPPFTIDRLTLYRSHLSPRGARYEAVGEFPLG